MVAMLGHFTVLAAEHGKKLGLTGHIRGVVVVVMAITLFCGSIYLLLATNLGTRLGFLVAAAGLTGFIMLLSLLWATSANPIDKFHGIESHWTVKEVKNSETESFFGPVRTIDTGGKKANETEAGDIKAVSDTALTTEGSDFQTFQRSDQYIVLDTKVIGGGRTGLLNLKHRPLFATLKIQGVKEHTTCATPPAKQEPGCIPFGQPPPTPEADPAKPVKVVVLERNLGSIRLPQYLTVLGSGLLFGLCLLSMHRMERAAQAAAAAPAPA
jgi:hypothetical protein